MKRQIVILAALLAVLASVTAPLAAQDLVGEWQFKRQARNGAHTGTIVIDQNGQAGLTAQGPIQSYAQCGHVKVASDKVEIVFTSVKSVWPYSLDHFYCTRRGDGFLSCYNVDGVGKENDLFTMGRIGGVPVSAAGRFDVCPSRESPQVRGDQRDPALDLASVLSENGCR
jgi:hypothetical protein